MEAEHEEPSNGNHALVGLSFRYLFARWDWLGLQRLSFPLSEDPLL